MYLDLLSEFGPRPFGNTPHESWIRVFPKLIELNAMEHKSEISAISVAALQEASLREMLAKVEELAAETAAMCDR